jgi:hypothetical protein
MTPARIENMGHFVHLHPSGKAATFESGAYVAATYVSGTGYVIDRRALPQFYQSCKIGLAARADLASGHKISASQKLQHSSATAGGGFTDLATQAAADFWKNTGTATSVIRDKAVQLAVNLRSAKRYLRHKWRHSGNSTATGSNLNFSPVVVFGGSDTTPASATGI